MSDQAEIWTFPTNPEEFEHDSRISFSRLDRKYIAVQDDGTEYEFDSALKRWVPMIDEALIEEHQSAYAAPHADDGSSSSRQQDPAQGRKRKNDQANDREVSCRSLSVPAAFFVSLQPIQLLPSQNLPS